MYRNKFDTTGQCSEDGQKAENGFKHLALKRQFLVREATEKEQYEHIDYVLSRDKQIISVDVKARKKISRSSSNYNDDLVWVEWKNVQGKRGWLLGKAELIAFEKENDYVVVSRKNLADLCEKLVDKTKKVDNSHEALNKIYTRYGRKDEVSLIRWKDIEEGIRTVHWKK